jgi:hypothetical protein
MQIFWDFMYFITSTISKGKLFPSESDPRLASALLTTIGSLNLIQRLASGLYNSNLYQKNITPIGNPIVVGLTPPHAGSPIPNPSAAPAAAGGPSV